MLLPLALKLDPVSAASFPFGRCSASNFVQHSLVVDVSPVARSNEREMMLKSGKWLLGTAILCLCVAAGAQTVEQAVQEAVNTELHADAQDHTHWMYYEVDLRPGNNVEQWVANSQQGSLTCVVNKNGHKISKDQQRAAMDSYINNPALQARRRRGAQHDDRQAAQMLRLLPQAFIWTKVSSNGQETTYRFRPNPQFSPSTLEARVFAAMAGEMAVDNTQHRIAMLQGKLIHDVKFFFGIFGNLQSGGTFFVQREQLAPGVWQITKAKTNIQGKALLFKSISDQENDVKWKFKRLPDNLTYKQAEDLLLEQQN